MSKIRCEIEKYGDYGYMHFNDYVPMELIPVPGETISLIYPDGGIKEFKRIRSVIKVFDRDGDVYLKILVE